jgi:hypothetical protein
MGGSGKARDTAHEAAFFSTLLGRTIVLPKGFGQDAADAGQMARRD